MKGVQQKLFCRTTILGIHLPFTANLRYEKPDRFVGQIVGQKKT